MKTVVAIVGLLLCAAPAFAQLGVETMPGVTTYPGGLAVETMPGVRYFSGAPVTPNSLDAFTDSLIQQAQRDHERKEVERRLDRLEQRQEQDRRCSQMSEQDRRFSLRC